MDTQCSVCGAPAPESELVMSEHGKICRSCESDIELEPSSPLGKLQSHLDLPPAGVGGLVMVGLPFFFTFHINDLIITSVIFGTGAVFGGAGAIYQANSSGKLASPKFLAALLVIVGLGIFHILDGLRII